MTMVTAVHMLLVNINYAMGSEKGGSGGRLAF